MKLLRSFVGSALLITILGLSISGCDKIPPASAGEPALSISYQETTATITVNWKRPSNAADSWQLHYEWTNNRQSGGNACEKAEATTQTTVTFTCSRSESTIGVMRFEVWAVRTVDGQAYPGPRSSATYEVAPAGVTPPGEIDSLTIVVTDASTGMPIRLGIEGIRTTYEELDNNDTLWVYNIQTEAGVWQEHTRGYSSTDHGIQLTALGYLGGAVVLCDGDCRAFPDLEAATWPEAMPFSLVMAN